MFSKTFSLEAFSVQSEIPAWCTIQPACMLPSCFCFSSCLPFLLYGRGGSMAWPFDGFLGSTNQPTTKHHRAPAINPPSSSHQLLRKIRQGLLQGVQRGGFATEGHAHQHDAVPDLLWAVQQKLLNIPMTYDLQGLVAQNQKISVLRHRSMVSRHRFRLLQPHEVTLVELDDLVDEVRMCLTSSGMVKTPRLREVRFYGNEAL